MAKQQSSSEFFDKITRKIDKIKRFAEEINKTEGKNVAVENVLIEGPSKMYKNHQDAVRAMTEPQIAEAFQKIEGRIRQILKDGNA